MRYISRFCWTGLILFALLPRSALAGMPMVTLTEWAQLRVETLSFCLLVFLLSATVIRALWNWLARDFPVLPRLSYGKTLAGITLLGLGMAVVLTMIAGARELLTPGAWERSGLLYKLPEEQPTPTTASDGDWLDLRRERLVQLRRGLWDYSDRHEGRFPESIGDSGVPMACWDLPRVPEMHYRLVSGCTRQNADEIVAFEPDVFDGPRLALETSGRVVTLSSEELRIRLLAQAEEEPAP